MSLPNYNAANKDSLAGVLQEVLKQFGLTLENCIPAVVVSYQRGTINTAVVQPAINVIKTDGSIQPRDKITLPVHVYGGGGVVISTPLKEGDTGWIIAGDRDISLFKQSLKVSNPNTYRTHKFSFGFFLPDKVSGFTVSTEDSEAFLIQTLDGSTKISLKNGYVAIKTTGNVDVNGAGGINVETSGNLTAKASSATITAATVTVDGNLNVTGDVVAGTVSLKSHIHTAVTPGTGTTGGPQQ